MTMAITVNYLAINVATEYLRKEKLHWEFVMKAYAEEV